MAWKNFANYKHYYTGTDPVPGLNKYYVTFQYDSEVSTPEYVKYRVICNHDSWTNGYGTDYIYLYSPERLYCDLKKTAFTQSCLLHDGNDRKIPYQMSGKASKENASGNVVLTDTTVTEFYLFKNWNDAGFTFPEFWICVQGREGTLGAFDYKFFNPTTGKRRNYVTKITAGSGSLPYYDGWTPKSLSGTKGTLIINDNKNNTFTISGTLPEDAVPGSYTTSNYPYVNSVESAYIRTSLWRDSNESDVTVYEERVDKSSTEVKNKEFSYDYGPLDNCNYTNVKADLTISGKYDNPSSPDTVTATIAHYVAPKSMQSRPVIECYADEALRMKMNNISPEGYVKISWDIPEGGNLCSPTTDARFFLLTKKSTSNTWQICGTTINNSTASALKGITYSPIRYCDVTTPDELFTEYNFKLKTPTAPDGKDYTMKIDSSTKSCYVVMPVKDLGLQVGDSIKVAIEQAHSHSTSDGLTDNWSIIRFVTSEEDMGMSIVYEVVSSWPIKIKNLYEEWDNGYVYVKTDNKWLPSQAIYVKISEEWEKINLM